MSKRTSMPLKLIAAFILLTSFMPCAAAVCSSDYCGAPRPVYKLGRGLTHLLSSPFQVPNHVIQAAGEAKPVWVAPWEGMTVGAGRGLYHFGRQAVSGVIDIFTFFTPAGRNWEPVFPQESLFPVV